MRIENTLLNKAKFFALYYRQKVMKTDQTSTILCDPVAIGHGDWYLELTPLSQITEQDKEYLELKDGLSFDEYGCSYSMGEESWSSYDIDYLRSKGYAIPWLGVSIETLIEWGWIKLKQDATN